MLSFRTRTGALLLILLVLISALAVGCQANSSNSSAATTKAATSSPTTSGTTFTNLNPAGQFPIVKNRVQLSVLVTEDFRNSDWKINDQTKFVEQLTGIDLVFKYIPSAESGQQKLKLIITSNDLPDVIFLNIPLILQNFELLSLGKEGIILPIDQYIKDNGFYIKKLFEYSPVTQDVITYPDGKIYAVPTLNESYHSQSHQTFFLHPLQKKHPHFQLLEF